MSVQRTYVYKVYRQGVYLGDIPYVISDFGYSLEINSAGTQIEIEVGQSADTIGLAPVVLTTEDSEWLLTEDGSFYITTETADEVVGDSSDSILIRNGNRVVVYMQDEYNPNGKVMFTGTIERWEAPFGDDGGNDAIKVLVYSDGQDLNNIIIPGSDSEFADQSNTTYVSNQGQFVANGSLFVGGVPKEYDIAQTFKTGSGVTNISSIKVRLYFLSWAPSGETITVYLSLYNSLSSITSGQSAISIASRTFTVPNTGSSTYGEDFYLFTFSLPVTVSSLSTYAYRITMSYTQYTAVVVVDSSANSYANGKGYQSQPYSIGSHPSSYDSLSSLTPSEDDFYFITYTSAYTTLTEFTTQDPADMFRSIIDTYRNQGGILAYDVDSVDDTPVNVPYTFSLATSLEGVRKTKELAPYDWYWAVSLSTNTIYYKQTATTADVTLLKGTHIQSLRIISSTENLANFLYFSGGDVGAGVNLYKTYSDSDSIDAYGIRIDRQSDNRVTVTGTANALGNAYIAANKDQQYQTYVTLNAATIDISQFIPGMTIGFSGFGTFVDSLIIQIVRIEYSPDVATLYLGSLPPRNTTTLQQALADINSLQTIANPDTPS